MAKRKKIKTNEPKNTLATLLEEGKPIEGLVGFVPIDYKQNEDEDEDQIFVKVKVVGVNVDGCNIKVVAELVSGNGRILISPCQFVDGPKDVEARRDRSKRLKIAHEQFKELGKPYYHHQRVKRVEDFVAERMTPEEQKEFHANVKTETNSELKKVAKHQLTALAAVACLVVNKVENEDVDNYSWRW